MSYGFCTTPDEIWVQVAISRVITITVCRSYFRTAIPFTYLEIWTSDNIESSFIAMTFWKLIDKSCVWLTAFLNACHKKVRKFPSQSKRFNDPLEKRYSFSSESLKIFADIPDGLFLRNVLCPHGFVYSNSRIDALI